MIVISLLLIDKNLSRCHKNHFTKKFQSPSSGPLPKTGAQAHEPRTIPALPSKTQHSDPSGRGLGTESTIPDHQTNNNVSSCEKTTKNQAKRQRLKDSSSARSAHPAESHAKGRGKNNANSSSSSQLPSRIPPPAHLRNQNSVDVESVSRTPADGSSQFLNKQNMVKTAGGGTLKQSASARTREEELSSTTPSIHTDQKLQRSKTTTAASPRGPQDERVVAFEKMANKLFSSSSSSKAGPGGGGQGKMKNKKERERDVISSENHEMFRHGNSIHNFLDEGRHASSPLESPPADEFTSLSCSPSPDDGEFFGASFQDKYQASSSPGSRSQHANNSVSGTAASSSQNTNNNTNKIERVEFYQSFKSELHGLHAKHASLNWKHDDSEKIDRIALQKFQFDQKKGRVVEVKDKKANKTRIPYCGENVARPGTDAREMSGERSNNLDSARKFGGGTNTSSKSSTVGIGQHQNNAAKKSAVQMSTQKPAHLARNEALLIRESGGPSSSSSRHAVETSTSATTSVIRKKLIRELQVGQPKSAVNSPPKPPPAPVTKTVPFSFDKNRVVVGSEGLMPAQLSARSGGGNNSRSPRSWNPQTDEEYLQKVLQRPLVQHTDSSPRINEDEVLSAAQQALDAQLLATDLREWERTQRRMGFDELSMKYQQGDYVEEYRQYPKPGSSSRSPSKLSSANSKRTPRSMNQGSPSKLFANKNPYAYSDRPNVVDRSYVTDIPQESPEQVFLREKERQYDEFTNDLKRKYNFTGGITSESARSNAHVSGHRTTSLLDHYYGEEVSKGDNSNAMQDVDFGELLRAATEYSTQMKLLNEATTEHCHDERKRQLHHEQEHNTMNKYERLIKNLDREMQSSSPESVAGNNMQNKNPYYVMGSTSNSHGLADTQAVRRNGEEIMISSPGGTKVNKRTPTQQHQPHGMYITDLQLLDCLNHGQSQSNMNNGTAATQQLQKDLLHNKGNIIPVGRFPGSNSNRAQIAQEEASPKTAAEIMKKINEEDEYISRREALLSAKSKRSASSPGGEVGGEEMDRGAADDGGEQKQELLQNILKAIIEKEWKDGEKWQKGARVGDEKNPDGFEDWVLWTTHHPFLRILGLNQ